MVISAKQERVFEKKYIEKQKDRYLKTNVVDRYNNDIGYREKVDTIINFLKRVDAKGYILDVGSNTSGESEFLFHLGYKMIPTDINEIALSFSKKRAKQMRNEELFYFAADAHAIPIEDNSFENIVVFEALHHMEEPNTVISELHRVLLPGGHLFTLEPYALNPYRILSSIRDYLRGTIEKSFSVFQLRNLFTNNGFEVISIQKAVLPTSTWKKQSIGSVRSFLRDIYYSCAKNIPWLFGSVILVAKKPGELVLKRFYLEDRLICPITRAHLCKVGDSYVSTNTAGKQYSYPVYEGVPVLIKEDAWESCV
ncbi:MAG: methyltransferase domain-containing protein [Deltaproteobacteria bacterium]|nr:methyltransferase domain-containing protein [Deltaproteobacteria bacterium]